MTNNEKQKDNKKDNKISFKERLICYLKGVKAEWGKVSWPQKNQIIAETIIVVIVVTFFTLVVYFMDVVFKGILGLL